MRSLPIQGRASSASREGLPALQVGARSALDRFQQKLDGQTPADDQAAALAADQRDVESAESKTPVTDAAGACRVGRRPAADRKCVSNLEAPDAPLAKAEAIRLAAAAARALEAPAGADKPVGPREAIAHAMDAALALARHLADEQSTRERTRVLAHAQQMLVGPRARGDLADLARQEHHCGRAGAAPRRKQAERPPTRSRPLPYYPTRPPASTPVRAPTRRLWIEPATGPPARSTSWLPLPTTSPTPPVEMHRPRHEARAPDDKTLGVTPADHTDAAALAQRQRHIREGLQAILGETGAAQQALRERSTALGREVADLRDRARDISPRSQWPAHAAADLLGRAAPESMDRGAVGFRRGPPGEALHSQRQAADQAEQGARHTEDLAAALRSDRPAGAVDPPPTAWPLPRPPREGPRSISRRPAPRHSPVTDASQATRAAAVAMHKAAQSLRAGDRAARGTSRARESASTSTEPRGTIAGKGDPDLAGLKAAVRAKTGRTWGELPGHLRTEILQMSQGRYRDDYARLIELYFREIAADAADRGARP